MESSCYYISRGPSTRGPGALGQSEAGCIKIFRNTRDWNDRDGTPSPCVRIKLAAAHRDSLQMKRHTDEKEGDGKRYRLDGPGGHCAERNGSDRESQSSHNFTYMWTLQNKINNSDDKIGNKLTETENILRATRQDAGWGRQRRRAKGLGSASGSIQHRHRDVQCSTRKTVHGAVWKGSRGTRLSGVTAL